MKLELNKALVALVNEDIKHIAPVINGKQLRIFVIRKEKNDKSACRKYVRIRIAANIGRYNRTGFQTVNVPIYGHSEEYLPAIINAVKELVA